MDFRLHLPWICLFLHAYGIGLITAKCTSDQYQCFNGDCISLDEFCDERPDCSDSSDETDCFNECLLRGDIYGMLYIGERRITANGLHCDQQCRWDNGTAPQCVSVDGQIQYCQIPSCGDLQEESLEYPLFHGLLKWKMIDLDTYKEVKPAGLEVEDSTLTPGGRFILNGTNNTHFVLKSPVVKDINRAHCARIEYSLTKSKNVDVKLIDWGQFSGKPETQTTLDGTNAECSHCVLRIVHSPFATVQYQAKVYISAFPQGNFSLTFEIKRVALEMECGWSYDVIEDDVECPYETYKCMKWDVRCVSTDVINDKYQDCRDALDEQADLWLEREICGPNTMTCHGSNSCLDLTSPLGLIDQCISNQSHLPVQATITSCPSYYMCKHENILPPSLLTCVSETEICDGVPQCPHWDDELDCPLLCPSECTLCDIRRFKCPPSVLHNISSRVSYLDLSGHLLDIRLVCSVQRIRLVFLNMSSCGLTDVACLSNTTLFPKIQTVDVSDNNILVVYKEYWQESQHFTTLILDRNPIRLIMVQLSKGILSLRNCSIHTVIVRESFLFGFNSVLPWLSKIDSLPFIECSLKKLDLSFNDIDDIELINACYNLQDLNLHRNKIRNISYFSFIYLKDVMINLTLSANMIEYLYDGIFQGFEKLKFLNLSANSIHRTEKDAFKTLSNLLVLDISSNKIAFLPIGIFDDLQNIVQLYIQGNMIEILDVSLLKVTSKLELLNLSGNRLSFIPRHFFLNLTKLIVLDIRGNEIVVKSDMFGGLGVLQYLKVGKYSLCCARPSSVNSNNCEAGKDHFSSCYHLLGSKFLSVTVWIMICPSLCGNIYLLWFKRSRFEKSEKWRLCLITNIAFSDILISLYLLVIGLVDVMFRGTYELIHDLWRNNIICTVIGVLATTSILTHNIFLICHSFLRLFPERRIPFFVLSVLILSLIICVLPIISSDEYFYSSTNICLPLPSVKNNATQNRNNVFSYGFFIIGTLITVIIVILREIKFEQRMQRKRETGSTSADSRSFSQKLCLFYGLSHFLRCVPVFVLGFMTMMERYVTSDTYTFVAVFAVPMNAAVNPMVQIYLLWKQPNKSLIKNVCLKTVWPQMLKLRSIRNEPSDLFLVTSPKLSKKHVALVILRGESGWMQKVSKVHIINKVIKCCLPKYKDHQIAEGESVSIQLYIEELNLRSNSVFINVST